jgi:hypothetical protein
MVLTLSAGAFSNTIHVTTTAQGITDDGKCSLQEAIYAANFDFGVAPSLFNPIYKFDTGCEPGSGADTIELEAGATYHMTSVIEDPYNYMGPTATPIVFSDITIAGNGALLLRDNLNRDFSGTIFRAFAIGRRTVGDPNNELDVPGDGVGKLTIYNLHIKGFVAKGGIGASGGGGGMGAGGAIYVSGGALTVVNCTFDDNGAGGGNGGTGGSFGPGGGGGGFHGNGAVGAFRTGFIVTGTGGGGGGARANGGTSVAGSNDGAGGGGTQTAGNGSNGGYRCGGPGGGDGGDGGAAPCAGGGGGGGGNPEKFPLLGTSGGDGGTGNYGGGGGGGGFSDQPGTFQVHDYLEQPGGHGGFGGGGGGSSGTDVDQPDVERGSGGDGGFGGGGGAGDSAGSGGTFAGNGGLGGGGGGAGLGGAIFGDTANITIQNSTFRGNYGLGGYGATGGGTDGRSDGSAIFLVDGVLTVEHATIAYNETIGGGAVVVYRSTRDNSSATFVLKNTIVANNSPAAHECFFVNGVSASGNGNLLMNNTVAGLPFATKAPCPGAVQTTDPGLGPLQPNPPGLTPTMAIDETSPASAQAIAALPSDQRGVTRPRGAGSDIGAYEAGNSAPVAHCQNVTVPAGASCQANASIDNGSSDPDGDTITLTQAPPGPYSLGATSVTLTATDPSNASGSCSATVTVADTAGPTITPTVTSSVLNANKNHELLNVGLGATASDQCSTPPTSFLVRVYGDEDDQAPTDSKGTVFSPDARNVAIGTLRLRAERTDAGDGRVYLIVVSGSDSSGNSGFGCSAVMVPYSNSASSLGAVTTQAAAAVAYCQSHSGAAPPGYFSIGDGPVIGPKQ